MLADAILRERVGQLRRRVRLLVTARWVFAALFAASLLCSIFVVLDRLAWIAAPPEYLAGLLGLGAVVGAAIGLTRPISLMDAAQLADRRLGLKERLSSGIDFLQSGASDPMTVAQLADAAAHSQQLHAGDVFPFRAPREARFFLGSLVLLFALVFVPELSVFQSPKVQAEKAAIKKQGEQIEKLAKDYKKHDLQHNSQVARRIAANMQALGLEMRRGRLSKKQAMLKMGRLTQQLKDAQRQMALANMPRSLDQAALDMKKASENALRRGANPAGAKMLAAMARALGNKDFEGAAQLLQQLAQKLENGELKPEEAKAAADALSKMAAAMKGTSLDAAGRQMQEAAKRLAAAAKMSFPQMQQAMRQAGQSCAQAGGT